MRTLIKNIKELVQVERQPRLRVCGKDMAQMKTIKNAYLIIEDDKFAAFGPMSELKEQNADTVIDATGHMVLPSFCDSHTHIVYANSREHEFVDKIRGLSYEEIAKRGGGILNSAKATAAASEEELYDMALQRLEGVMRMGTGAIEIKSGYGLSTESELKLLRVIRRLKENSPMTIKSNFLGAHGIPMEYRGHQEDYVNVVINEMIPKVADEGLADFIDVFCDQGFFTVEDTARIQIRDAAEDSRQRDGCLRRCAGRCEIWSHLCRPSGADGRRRDRVSERLGYHAHRVAGLCLLPQPAPLAGPQDD